MAQTANLQITELAQNQAQPHVTLNAALERLDSAVASLLSKTLTASVTLTFDEGQTYATWVFGGSLGAGVNVTVQAPNRGSWIVKNSTGQTVTVKRSGQTGVAVANGKKQILFDNGTDIEAATAAL